MKLFLSLNLLIISAFSLAGQTTTTSYADSILQFRVEYRKDFLMNDRSPLRSDGDLMNLRFYDPDNRFRFVCTFKRTPDEKPFDLPTYSGITKSYVKYGTLTFKWKGKTQVLSVYQNLSLRNIPQFAEHLFLPFRDLTNDDTTYGGGRYIDLKISDVEAAKVILDFNKSYNPWCAYSDGYNCPIPPTENTLDFAIEAGEKLWAGKKKTK